MPSRELPIPPHFDPRRVGQVYRVPYQELALEASKWAREHRISVSAEDRFRICLLGVDLQNTFCTPGFELFVGGRSGMGAVEDSQRLCQFIYRNLGVITQHVVTMDTHHTTQIFHPVFLVNEKGEHPQPYTRISTADVIEGRWRINPAVARGLGLEPEHGQQHLRHYVETLRKGGKYELTIWPYHAMLGGIGHALVSCVEEAIFFHSVARLSQPSFHIKGDNPLTEHYSAMGPEVLTGPDGKAIASRNENLFRLLLEFDAIIIAGQAKSHCVSWTVNDLLNASLERKPELVEKIYLLEDCTSPVVVPGVVDYTDEANREFERFAASGMHIVRSTEPIESWPGINL